MDKKTLSWDRFLKPAGIVVPGLLLVLLAIHFHSRLKEKRARLAEAPPRVVSTPARVADTQSTAEIGLPNSLGGHVRVESLAKLLNAAHQYNLNLGQLRLTLSSFDGGRFHYSSTFPIGESFTVEMSSRSQCYYALIHHNSDGTFQLLVPEAGGDSEGAGKLKIGVRRVVGVHATPPGGEQEFMLICAEKPIDLESVLSGPAEAYKNYLSAVVFPYVAPAAK